MSAALATVRWNRVVLGVIHGSALVFALFLAL